MTGGTHEGNYYQPTVLKDVTPDMRIFYEESFGPVTSIIKAMDEMCIRDRLSTYVNQIIKQIGREE